MTACHIQLLERFQVRANLIVPILLPNENKHTLWGLLILHQCSAPRIWEESDIQLLQRLSVKLSIAIKQAIAYQKVENELADRNRAEQELLKLNQSLDAKVRERTQELWGINQLQRAILDGTDYAIISVNINGIIQTFNAGAEKMLGYSMGEVVGQVTPEIFHDAQEVSDKIAKASKIFGKDIGVGFEALKYMEIEGLFDEEWIHIRKDGSSFPVAMSVTILRDDNGQIIGAVSFAKDISDLKLAENALRESQALLQTVLDAFPLSVFWKDLESVYLGCNKLFAHTTSLNSVQDIIGKTDFDFSNSQAQVLNYRADDLQVMESGIAKINFEEMVTKPTGEQIWVQTNKIPLRNREGNMIGVMGTFQDISDHKQAELQLKKTSDRLALALNSGAIACWEWDIVNNTIIWDERAYELHGIPLGTSVSFDTWANSIHPEDLQFTQTLSEQAVVGEGEFDAEYRVIHPDQSIHFLKGYGLVVRDIDGSPQKMIGVNFDISARKQAELQLQKTSDRLALALSSGAIGYWEWDIEQNSLAWDAQMYKLYGGAEATNSRMAYETWANTIHPDDHKATETLLQEAVLGLTDYDCEFRVIHPDHSIHFIKAYGKVEKNAQGKAQSMIGVNFDISDRKQSESQLKLANQELLRATKLKDEFLATMSHELRTPLNSILGLSESLKDEILGSINDKQLKALSIVESSGEHLLSLINDILDLSKISTGMMTLDMASVQVQNLCDTSLLFVKQQAFNKRIQIHSNIPAHINNINIDERRIKQVLINLLTNAVKFTPNEGKVNLFVAIGSGDTWQGEAKIPQRIKTINSPTILFQVVDTGIGINSRDLKILFQPFVQVDSALNRQYEGTGLGLALVKQIVELHGGQVMVDSEVGQGSSFTVALPYEMSQSNAIASAPTSTTAFSQDVNPVNPPLILLAEDNEANIQTFISYLTAVNYRVIIAQNGVEAIAQAKANLPDIILMDIQMPIMDGLEATRLIRLEPNLINTPIIALTALAMEGDQERCLAAGVNEYLVKPVKMRQLNLLIQKVLGSVN